MTIASITELICFLVLSLTLVAGSLGVVLLPNIVYSAFLLGGVFLSVAGLYLLLNASFVAAAQVLVYVGAVNVLILFAIMLVNKKETMAAIPGLLLRRVLSGAVCGSFRAVAPSLLHHRLGPAWPHPGGRRGHHQDRRAPIQRLPAALRTGFGVASDGDDRCHRAGPP
jgi:NAD(P)H-quinone oxidoreductase subunit 6